MLINNKKWMSVVLALSMAITVGCTDTSENTGDLVSENIKVNQDIKVETQKLKTSVATKEILYVAPKYTTFWKNIANNYIDRAYNKTKVKKGNIRLLTKANKEYANAWCDELEKTYESLKEVVKAEVEENITKQYKAFMKYYENTEKIYTFVLDTDDEYDSVVDGNYKVRQFKALADEVREYTILLKEYRYLYDGEIKFYTKKDGDKDADIDVSYKANKPELIFKITRDTKVKDVINDSYKKKIGYSLKKLNAVKAMKKANDYYKYWEKEVTSNYEKLRDELEGEHKDILKEQKSAFYDYQSATTKVQSVMLDASKYYKNLYKDNVKVENILHKGREYMEYNILLLEYYYAIKGKVKL